MSDAHCTLQCTQQRQLDLGPVLLAEHRAYQQQAAMFLRISALLCILNAAVAFMPRPALMSTSYTRRSRRYDRISVMQPHEREY